MYMKQGMLSLNTQLIHTHNFAVSDGANGSSKIVSPHSPLCCCNIK
uniref:Uncharacterized protein n=1 Tax=Arundo donax TaxID=35708 RepID=A0A0A9AM68_ARUDO